MVNTRRLMGLAGALFFVASSSIWAATIVVLQHSAIQFDDLQADVYKIVQDPGYPPPPPREVPYAQVSPMKDTGGSLKYVYGETIGGNTLAAGTKCKAYVRRKDAAGNYTITLSAIEHTAQ